MQAVVASPPRCGVVAGRGYLPLAGDSPPGSGCASVIAGAFRAVPFAAWDDGEAAGAYGGRRTARRQRPVPVVVSASRGPQTRTVRAPYGSGITSSGGVHRHPPHDREELG
ncbi:hypothetical protein GCM10010211_38930 [Streptomyces albospinus]|uniref:Uncharacterized protein n=1 Tax=Streptomyces albospinus TaxID=285515 RepID=A0ABQ2V5H7_9ACTN|nr:hypothetical protein GCM10010211_38930 [Streptomyces albospinus]